jgi:hypothetical protein
MCIDHALGTFFRTGAACDAQVHINVTGRLEYRHFKVSCLPGHALDFSKRQELNVGVPADLDQLG